MRQVAMKRVPFQIAKTVLVLPQSMVSNMSAFGSGIGTGSFTPPDPRGIFVNR
jgi:uncharacterized FlgJ-related protein